MKKTLMLISVLTISLLLAVVAPVLATVPTVSEVTATQVGGFTAGTLTYHINEGGVFFFDGETSGTVALDIASTLAAPDYVLVWSGTINASINTKTDDGELHYKLVWELKQDDIVLGTFEGTAKARSTTFVYNPTTGLPHPFYSTNIYHCVLQGSGVFAGQTLRLEGIRPTYDPAVYPPVGPANPLSWEGTLLAR